MYVCIFSFDHADVAACRITWEYVPVAFSVYVYMCVCVCMYVCICVFSLLTMLTWLLVGLRGNMFSVCVCMYVCIYIYIFSLELC
jgi:hypothetical protein